MLFPSASSASTPSSTNSLQWAAHLCDGFQAWAGRLLGAGWRDDKPQYPHSQQTAFHDGNAPFTFNLMPSLQQKQMGATTFSAQA